MDHFDGSSANERFNNNLLNEIRKTNELLEQIAQLLQPKQDTQQTKPSPRGKSQ